MANKSCLVLGGGVSGLTAAWNLATKNKRIKVILLEASPRVGGWVRSVKTRQGGIFELGPRSIRFQSLEGKTLLNMLSDLQLGPFVVPVTSENEVTRLRLIFSNEHNLVAAPMKWSQLLLSGPLFSRPLLLAVLKDAFAKKKTGKEDESVHDFITRRFSSELADWILDPLCRGVYAGSSKELSMRSAFPIIYNWERRHRSVLWGSLNHKEERSEADKNPLVRKAKKEKWYQYTLQGGLERITESLRVALLEAGGEIHTSTPALQLQFTGNGVKVLTEQMEYKADHLISAIPANALAQLLELDHAPLSNLLASIKSVSIAVVNLEYPGQVIPTDLVQSFGYLVPSHQKSKILGTAFDSSSFPELDAPGQSTTRLTVMMGGRWFEEVFGSPDTVNKMALKQIALEELSCHLGISVEPTECLISVHKEAIPQYTIGHADRLGQIVRYLLDSGVPMSVTGGSYSGVGVVSCVYNALRLTDLLLLTNGV